MDAAVKPPEEQPKGFVYRALNWVERVGNKLPDPAMIFVIFLGLVWLVSWWLSGYEFTIPANDGDQVRSVQNQLTGASMAAFLASMVRTFVTFPPLGVVLVAMLGVGVAEHVGFINAAIKSLLGVTPKFLLTPMLLLVAIVSHTAADVGYVLVIPLGGVIFYAAGRHPLAGIGCAFAGVSGGFAANFIPSAIDPLLQGFTQLGAQVLDPAREVNPLCNIYFTGASSLLVIGVGWFLTDRIIEPRLAGTTIDADPEDRPTLGTDLEPQEKRGLWAGLAAMLVGLLVLISAASYRTSPLLDPDPSLSYREALTSFSAPLMQSIVPLIFLLFLIPGIVYGYVAGSVKSHRDIIQGMSKSMSTMGYYMVMAFCAALFTYAFAQSQLGALLAVKGADFLKALGLPGSVTIVGIIFLAAIVNLLVGSASAKWALLAPIFVPILMQVGLSPELTQAAYRVGDSTTNIITPLMPYFPLVVAFSQRWVKKTGIGTITSMMLPYSFAFLILWTAFLILYWQIGLPLGLSSTYVYP